MPPPARAPPLHVPAGDRPAVVVRSLRHRVEHPLDRSGLAVDRGDQPARNVMLRLRESEVEGAVEVRGARRQLVTGRVLVGILELQGGTPDLQPSLVGERFDDPAGLCVDRVQDRLAIRVNLAVAVDRSAAGGGKRRVDLNVPEQSPGRGVDREQLRPGVDVHHAVDDERVVPRDAVDGARIIGPLHRQTRDVRRVDLVERRIPAVADVEVVQRPVDVGARSGRGLSAGRAAERHRNDGHARTRFARMLDTYASVVPPPEGRVIFSSFVIRVSPIIRINGGDSDESWIDSGRRSRLRGRHLANAVCPDGVRVGQAVVATSPCGWATRHPGHVEQRGGELHTAGASERARGTNDVHAGGAAGAG